MDEAFAWLQQAVSDRAVVEQLLGSGNGAAWCHAVAKCQQAVEKAVKAIAVAMRALGVDSKIGYGHSVKRPVRMLVSLPRRRGTREVANHLSRLLDQNTQAAIDRLENLTPKQPLSGQPHRRNTEYPFEDPRGGWTYPAAPNVFSSEEVQDFRKLAHRVVAETERIIRSIQRAPR